MKGFFPQVEVASHVQFSSPVITRRNADFPEMNKPHLHMEVPS